MCHTYFTYYYTSDQATLSLCDEPKTKLSQTENIWIFKGTFTESFDVYFSPASCNVFRSARQDVIYILVTR